MGSLVLSNVARSFGDVVAVRDVSFTVPAGSTFGLLGPNGAGKTTTMRMILGILVPDRGTVTWDGAPIDGRVRRRSFGYLPEERGLYGKLKVRDQIAYFGRLHGVPRPLDARRADAVDRAPGPGRVRRTGPAPSSPRATSRRSRSPAPRSTSRRCWCSTSRSRASTRSTPRCCSRRCAALRAAGTTLILSSHQMWQIEDLCERFCVIAGGVVRAAGTLRRAARGAGRPGWSRSSRPTRRCGRCSPGCPARARCRPSERPALAYEVPADADTAALLRRLVAAGDVTRFERLEPSLRDIYLRATEAAA